MILRHNYFQLFQFLNNLIALGFFCLLLCVCTSVSSPEVDVRCLSLLLLILFFEVGVSLNLVLVDSDRPNKSPGSSLSLPPLCWDCSCTLPCRAFLSESWGLDSGFDACGASTLSTGLSPQPLHSPFSPVVYIPTNNCHQQCTSIYILTKNSCCCCHDSNTVLLWLCFISL